MSQPSAHGAASYRAEDLAALARALLERAGLPQDKADDVAEVLLDGDLLGKSTHGLALLPLYLREIETGGMTAAGRPLRRKTRPPRAPRPALAIPTPSVKSPSRPCLAAGQPAAQQCGVRGPCVPVAGGYALCQR